MEAEKLLIAVMLGLAAGAFYFGGLWFTVTLLTKKRFGAGISLLSFFARLFITAAIFYWIALYAGFAYILISVLAFFLSKLIIIRLKKPDKNIFMKKAGGRV